MLDSRKREGREVKSLEYSDAAETETDEQQ
jgi:hypothetical protein